MAVLGFKGERGYSAYEIAVQHGFQGSEETWLAQLGMSNGYDKKRATYTTKAAGEKEFGLPEGWSSNSTVEVYVGGRKLSELEYDIDEVHRKVTLKTPIQEVGTIVEITATDVSVTSVPIVKEINASSTDNTAPSAKCVYNEKLALESKIKGVSDNLEKQRVPAGGKTNDLMYKTSDEDNKIGWKSIADIVYPVGSLYMSTVETNPRVLFGGTWEKIEDRFLLGAGSNHVAGETGGEEKHKMTLAELVEHRHELEVPTGNNAFWVQAPGYGYIPVKTDETGAGRVNVSTARPTKVGQGQPFNIMPPYLTVYMWKRTA